MKALYPFQLEKPFGFRLILLKISVMDLFVRNFPDSLTDLELSNLFRTYGQVLSARVIKDRETGISRCFGFVNMMEESDGKLAIRRMNGQMLEGRTLTVKKAMPLKPQQKPVTYISRERKEKAEC